MREPPAMEPSSAAARICVIRQGYFPLDTRVGREVRALEAAGHQVDVICLRRPGEKLLERVGSVMTYRLPLPIERGGRLRYVFQYGAFLIAAALLAAALHVRRRWDIVQANSMPDALVFAAAVPRLFGARVLLDLHETMPEFLAEKYGLSPTHPLVRFVAWQEQASIRFADEAITCTEQMREAFVTRGADPEKITVVLNAADEAVFDARRHPPAPRALDHFTVICHGAVEERYGHDTLVRAAAILRDEIPGLRIEVFGEGGYRDGMRELARELGVEDRLWMSDGWAPVDDLVAAIAQADAGVVAIKRDSFRDLTHCNKMFDFIAMRRPAIVSRTRSVEEYFDDSCFALFESGDEHQLAHAIRRLYEDPELGQRLVSRASEVNEPYRWPYQRKVYEGVIERLSRRAVA
jgi:glycosyltransferase involved in cell wall biosynthesis